MSGGGVAGDGSAPDPKTATDHCSVPGRGRSRDQIDTRSGTVPMLRFAPGGLCPNCVAPASIAVSRREGSVMTGGFRGDPKHTSLVHRIVIRDRTNGVFKTVDASEIRSRGERVLTKIWSRGERVPDSQRAEFGKGRSWCAKFRGVGGGRDGAGTRAAYSFSIAWRVWIVSASSGPLSKRYRLTRAKRRAMPPGYRVLAWTPSIATSTTCSGRRWTAHRSRLTSSSGNRLGLPTKGLVGHAFERLADHDELSGTGIAGPQMNVGEKSRSPTMAPLGCQHH